MARQEIRFKNGEDTVTLWVEKEIDEYTLGWCPELQNNIAVHADNIVHEPDPRDDLRGIGVPDPSDFPDPMLEP